MSTHCGIAVKTDRGYRTIYCHNDGYPSYMYPVLTESYNSEALASLLISGGNASFIAKKFSPTTTTHSFDRPEKDVCIFYYRDRGESWGDCSPEYYTKEQLFTVFWNAYVWEDGCWTAYENGKKVIVNA